MGSRKHPRGSVPLREKVQVEHRSHTRHQLRAERVRREKLTSERGAREERAVRGEPRGRKQRAAQRRKAAKEQARAERARRAAEKVAFERGVLLRHGAQAALLVLAACVWILGMGAGQWGIVMTVLGTGLGLTTIWARGASVLRSGGRRPSSGDEGAVDEEGPALDELAFDEPEAPPPPNEAALAALDRDGRPLEVWRQALRASFADAGYRRPPPLPTDELLRVISDVRVAAERRIGAALVLALQADDEVRTRVRIASDSLESEALRVAVERASEGTLEEDALEEAVARDEAHPPASRVR